MGEMSMYGKSGHFTLSMHLMMLLKYNFEGFMFKPLMTLIACRAMQLRYFKGIV